jgi:NADP-dependent 3-hydroxy acid dehydrogenase YdfG
MVETNLLGVLYATHLFVDDLCDGGDDVVNLSSVAGRIARPASNVYRRASDGDRDLLRRPKRHGAPMKGGG